MIRAHRFAIGLGLLALLAACQEDEAAAGDPIDTAAAARGEALAQDCVACHALADTVNGLGPHLVGLYGRQVASVAGFTFSDALASEDFAWETERLTAFLLNPTEAYPGTMMAYDGLTEAEARDISEYFRSEAAD